MAGFDIRQIHRSLDARERQTGEARVQASKGSTGAVQAAGAYTEPLGARLGRTVGAEGLPALVAIGASALAAGDPELIQISGDVQGRLEIHLAETV